MRTLANLSNDTAKRKPRKRVGRGIGSGHGKTSGRGQKGAGARSGHTHRQSYEGGQVRLFQKLPTRGFTRGRWQKRLDEINLSQIEKLFQDGEEVTVETLREKGYLSGPSHGVKILGNGELTRKVTIKVNKISAGAVAKLEKASISYELLG